MRIHVLLLSLFLTLLAFTSSARADTEIDERYDENTEVEVKGTIAGKPGWGQRGMGTGRGGGPVILAVKTKHKSYRVVTAPAWYLERQGVSFDEGAAVEVRGSRYFSNDGTVYLIAREIRDPLSGRTTFFRDSTCKPMWRGQRMMNRHSQ